MRILITGSGTKLGRALVKALAARHEIKTLDLAITAGAETPSIVGDPRDRDVAARATADCDVIVHPAALVASSATPLDVLDAATRGTYNLLTTASSAKRFVLLSSLRHFERYPSDWWVTEQWAPRPSTDVADLAPYLAEVATREVARVLPLAAIGLRLGQVVDDADIASHAADPRWLHLEDAVQAVERAIEFELPSDGPRHGWWVYHIVGAGSKTRFPLGMAGVAPFGYVPKHDLVSGKHQATAPTPTHAITRFTDRVGGAARKVVVFGAGGPLAAVTTEALVRDHTLRLTDVRPLAEIVAEGKLQSPGAPLPRLLDPPHESRVVDVVDPEHVLAAARGMDAIINCTVVRPHPVQAFRVNTLGAYNVMRAAVACGIRRVVHTGPQQVTLPYPGGYWYDFGLGSDVPSRPGDRLYILSKFLGQEICRIFAEEHDLEVPTLLFSSFVNPTTPAPGTVGAFAFSISWNDSGEAMRQALRAPGFPHPFEVMHIVGDLPHGKYSNEKAKSLLAWQPRDRLEDHWRRPADR